MIKRNSEIIYFWSHTHDIYSILEFTKHSGLYYTQMRS